MNEMYLEINLSGIDEKTEVRAFGLIGKADEKLNGVWRITGRSEFRDRTGSPMVNLAAADDSRRFGLISEAKLNILIESGHARVLNGLERAAAMALGLSRTVEIEEGPNSFQVSYAYVTPETGIPLSKFVAQFSKEIMPNRRMVEEWVISHPYLRLKVFPAWARATGMARRRRWRAVNATLVSIIENKRFWLVSSVEPKVGVHQVFYRRPRSKETRASMEAWVKNQPGLVLEPESKESAAFDIESQRIRIYKVSLENLNKLRRALDITPDRPVDWGGQRNAYDVGPGSRDHKEFQEMERAALVREWPKGSGLGGRPTYSVTPSGGRLLGMSEFRIMEVWRNPMSHPGSWKAPISRGPGPRGPVPPV